MKVALITLFIFLSVEAMSQQKIDLSNPPSHATLFAEGFISTSINERDFAISPNGNEIYYTISTPQSSFQTIAVIKKDKNGLWSTPAIAPFAGKFSDLEPAFSADGKKLYFASNRPVQGNKPKDFDLWVVERNFAGWGEPKNLGSPINTETDEFYPSIARSGNLYFTAQYAGGVGREDIYQAVWINNHYEKPIALDTTVNSSLYEFNAFVDPDEQFILFTSYGRKDDTGRGDLYISEKGKAGKWMPARNLKSINSNKLDYCPYVSPDKKLLFFTSERSELPVSFESPTTIDQIKKIAEGTLNGSGNIYWIDWNEVKKVISH
ncbi:MAG: hypothetical protein L0Y35_07910 [Flammeovirgaceae bacterium]|nr:hypothetical protein [Flammeovirgaceae bacterium]